MRANPPDKKARAAAARAEASADSTTPKAVPPSKPKDPPTQPSAKALDGNDKGGKGQGKGKAKIPGTELSPCHNLSLMKPRDVNSEIPVVSSTIKLQLENKNGA